MEQQVVQKKDPNPDTQSYLVGSDAKNALLTRTDGYPLIDFVGLTWLFSDVTLWGDDND